MNNLPFSPNYNKFNLLTGEASSTWSFFIILIIKLEIQTEEIAWKNRIALVTELYLKINVLLLFESIFHWDQNRERLTELKLKVSQVQSKNSVLPVETSQV